MGEMMILDVVTGSQSVSGDNRDIFLLVGANASITLANNNCSGMLLANSNEYITLAGNDSNEHIFLYGSDDGISLTGKLTGLTDISGFAIDFVTLDSITPAQTTINPDGHGGTLVTLSGGGKIDFLGDPNVGIVAIPHGTTTILGNI
jgi:hypothetical protein